MPQYLANFLRSYIEKAKLDQIWLFPAKLSAVGHTMNIEKQFRRVVARAGLDSKEVVRHTLRHTAITHLEQRVKSSFRTTKVRCPKTGLDPLAFF